MQYFVNVRHNLAASDDFAEVVKVTNHLDQWDLKLAWYSLNTCYICLHGLKHDLEIQSFGPAWPCLIVKIFATQVKFLELCGFCILINYSFIFCVHTLTWYYQPLQVPSTVWTASVTWYMYCKLALIKILQNFWLTLANAFFFSPHY